MAFVGLLCVLLLLVLQSSLVPGLNINSISPRWGSVAGGTTVSVYGSGFSTDMYNSVNLLYLGTIPCDVISYTVSEDRLECVTRPYPGGEEGASYSRLQSVVLVDGETHITTGSNDAFTYHWSYTPQIWKLSPSSGPVGTQVEVGGYRFLWNYDTYSQFYIGSQVCELRDPQTNSQYGIRSKWPLLYVTCLTTEVVAGGWNASTTISGNRGASWSHSQSLYPVHDWSLAMYELFPDIQSVSPQLGSPKGGVLLTISGTGFSGEQDQLEVDIHGTPCQVVMHSSTMIQCWTGSPEPGSPSIADSSDSYPATLEGYRFRGSRGVRVEQYRSVGGSSVDDLQSASKYPDQPDGIFSFPSFSTGPDLYRHGSFGERLTAFFNPHSSGRHSFFASNDDQAKVWLGTGANLTAAYDSQIVDSGIVTGFENYHRYGDQRSAVQVLDQEEDYIIIGEFKEGGGADYFTVAALLHDDSTYSYQQTKQTVREEQRVTLSSDGLYDIQTVSVTVNSSAASEDEPVSVVLSWGGRETEPVDLLDLLEEPETLGDAVLDLFSGQCEFDVTHGLNHFPAPGGFDFEGGVNSDEVWRSWNGAEPVLTEEEALCGRHSLYVPESRALAVGLGSNNGQKTSDYPFLCLGYKVPPGHPIAVAVNVQDYGWYSIPLSGPDTGTPFTSLSSFFDELYSSEQFLDDDSWQYSCTDLQFMLIDNLPLEDGESPARSHVVIEVGVYSDPDSDGRGFFIDEFSLSSENRKLETDFYVAPARPNGRVLHSVLSSVDSVQSGELLTVTVALELVPTDCVDDLPLISINRTEGPGVVSSSIARTQSASSPLDGVFSLSFNGQTSTLLPHGATPDQIKSALELLAGVGEVTVSHDPDPLSHDLLGRYCPGRAFSVVFESSRGDLALLGADSSNLTGDGASITVTETTTGGLFLAPIPGHMLQTVETTPQVHVRVRGQLAACSGGVGLYEETTADEHSDYCGFTYTHTATPTVTMVTPASAGEGDSITITGSGFASNLEDVFIMFGPIECKASYTSNTETICTLGSGFGGHHQLYLHFTSSGLADTGTFGISYDITVDSVDLSSGSQAGGTDITISGTGFYSNDFKTESDSLASEYGTAFTATACPSGWETTVQIGGYECSVKESTSTSVLCTTPADPGSGGSYDITVSVGCVGNPSQYSEAVLAGGFSYDLLLTPSASSVSPMEGAVFGGEDITIAGSGFGADSNAVSVKIGGEECLVSSVSDTEVVCTSPAHQLGTWSVELVVTGQGKAAGDVMFTYEVEVTTVSHCTGSLFGGQVLSIDGSGFGSDVSGVSLSLGGRSCDITSVSNGQILCTTAPTIQTHYIDNNAEHSDYGLGYQWSPSSLTIQPGDTVSWSWTGSSFTARRGVAQVDSPGDLEYNGDGFRSPRAVTGSYSHTFTSPGTYYYIAEGFGHIGFNSSVTVASLTDLPSSLSLSLNDIPIDIPSLSPVCQQSGQPFTDYTYSADSTPNILSVHPTEIYPGGVVNFELSGLSTIAEDNILTFGGSGLTCSNTSPAVLSTTLSTPSTTASTTAAYTDSVTVVQCTLPIDILPGNYRALLHVAGRGWASAALEDTSLTVQPIINGSLSLSGVSLRGGVFVSFPTIGLVPEHITSTRVLVGNTPCDVHNIASSGEVTCLTQPAVDDGFSSIINRNSPVGYWSLQADRPFGGVDGVTIFSNTGSAGDSGDATIFGIVGTRSIGISDNAGTDQAAYFESSYLSVPSLEQFRRPAGFGAEFWLKLDQSIDSYAQVFSSSSFDSGMSTGYVVLINPCNQIEFWVATGSEAGLGSGSQLMDYCDLISDVSQCGGSCVGELDSSDSEALPRGVWNVIRSEALDLTDWTHVYFDWFVNNSSSDLFRSWQDTDCSITNPCTGTQTLSTNGQSLQAETIFLRSNADIEIGGTSSLTTGNLGAVGELVPFSGYLDEVAFYTAALSESEITDRVFYGSSEEQPVWVSVEGVDGIGTGAVPVVVYPEWEPEFSSEMVLDWDSVVDGMYTLDSDTALKFEWNGLRSIREVSKSVYVSCDLEAPAVREWAGPSNGGVRTVWLDEGRTHYFIDSVVGGCLEGRKITAHVGDTRTVEWRVGSYSDITITQGTGLLFLWDSGVTHDVIEMSVPLETASDCSKGDPSTRHNIGLVAKEWLAVPSDSGEVSVNGLSVGPHFFMCSVGPHCSLGMRLTVHVVEDPGSVETQQTSQPGPVVHTVPWRIQDYADLTIIQGESLEFSWEGFHSLHQVTEEVYESCQSSTSPLFEWGLPSVDSSATIDHLSPGDYYFLCAVAGHCDAGMKIKVTVLLDDGLPVLEDSVGALCADGVTCSLAYSVQATPLLTTVQPSEAVGGSTLTLTGSNILTSTTPANSPLTDVIVLVDKAPCGNVMAVTSGMESDHMISCDITDYESGYYHVDVIVNDKGFASVSDLAPGALRNPDTSAGPGSPYPQVFITAVASSVSPNSGSVNGGTVITITGSGYSSSIDRNSVYLDSAPCVVLEAGSDEISCVTPAGSGTADLVMTVNGYPVSTSLTYTYSGTNTPSVSSITGGNSLSSGDTLEIQGVLLANDQSEIRVQILESGEDFVEFSSDNECSVQSFSTVADVNTVTCIVPSKPAGTYNLHVHVLGYGFASVSDTVIYTLEVSSFTPTSSGLGGGVVLAIQGNGFPDDLSNGISITLCDGETESTNCVPISTSNNEVQCRLEATNTPSPFTTNTECEVTVSVGGQTSESVDTFEFNSTSTPRIDSIAPDIGGTGGGTIVTVTGDGFTALTTEPTSVMIDGTECEVTSITDTAIMCVTGNHTTTLMASVTVFVPAKGNALAGNGDVVTYEYVDLWSSQFTWGGGPLPVEGDSVYIRAGQTVFLDVDTPVLNLVLIEGSLIFQDEQDLHLQAHYIFINTGRLQVGTEDAPFTHQATITLHGKVTDPEIPIYGAKVLGIRQGELDLHGRPRHVTWTRLRSSALVNSSTLEVQDSVDWGQGDRIVIAPTGKDGNETEENEVLSVSADGHVITLLSPLNYVHHGVTDYYEGGHSIEIRAEVGLLSHNVVVQGSRPEPSGDEDAIDPQYGSQIFIHRTGSHPTPIRIEHTEIRYGGQAFRLGRYAVHFHLSGTMAGSYVRNCAIHHSNNRAITAHGVHDLLIEGNVAYDIKGHTYFVEDGIETNNQYLRNLGVLTRGSSSLLNTDQIPATFWITNPQNTFIGNAAAASRAYGFWYDFDQFPSGASRTGSVCPNKEPFGVFHDNTAHTCNEFGLRIWETYVPYADGCGGTQPQEANLTDFTTYANGINGVELSIVGHVRLIGFKVADNVQNGIVIIETLGYWGGPKIQDALIIAHTSVNSGAPQTGGIKTPNTPRLTVSNVTFVNFDSPATACLKACSHCKVRQGGFQVWFEELSFIGGSANHKAAFQWEYEVLYKDLDGSLTGLPDGGWVLPDSPLTPPTYCTPSVPEFSINSTVINGTVCTSDVNFLRMAWNRAEPLATLEDVPVLVGNEFGNSTIPWRHYRLTHLDGYMFTMPDGYQHTLVWDTPLEHNVDTTSYNAGVYGIRGDSRLWVTHTFVQEPDHINVGGNHEPTAYMDIPVESDRLFSWHLDNSTDPTRATYLVSGVNLTQGQNNNITYHYSYEPCPTTGCPPPQIDYGPYEEFQRMWSNPEHWPSGEVPMEGEDVIISSRWRMLMDVVPPTLGKVYILGELIVEDERDYNITADLILIQGEMARLFIGTEDEPFTHQVVITLRGLRGDEPLALSRRLNFGSKGIGVFGNLTIHGEQRTTWTRLSASASAGSDTITVEGTVDWREGDEIVIAPSGWDPDESEIRTVTDYQRSSGMVTLDQPLVYDHTIHSFLDPSDSPDPAYEGNSPWWGDGGSLAPEVGLLTHNIVIQGGEDPAEPLETHHYGCRILVGEYISGSRVYNGHLKLDSVEIRYCGQGGYFSPRDPRYAIAFASSFETSAGSYVKRCSLHHGYNTAIGVHSSYGIEISENVVWRTVDSGFKIGGRDNIVRDNLGILTSTIQPNSPLDNHAVDFPATFDVDGDNVVRGNAAAGSTRIGFRYAGELCLPDGTSPTHSDAMFWDNTAHCGLMGLVVLGLPNDCTAVGGFTATHQWNYGIFSSTASSLVVTHVKIATGKVGINLNIFGPNPVAHLRGNKYISMSDSLVVGLPPSESCDTVSPSFLPRSVSFAPGDHQIGVMMSSFNQKRSKMDGTGPWHLMKGYPVIDGVVNMNRVSFARFYDSGCAYKSVAIANNPLSPDAVHPIHLTGTNKLNVNLDNLVFFYEPKLEWIVQEDCIDMDCDGPKHALIRDNDGRFVSTSPALGSIIPFAELRFANYSHRLPVTWLGQGREDETLASPEDVLEHMGIARGQNGDLSHAAGGCVWMQSWGGYRCQGLQHTMLVIESLDEDTETRRLSPLALNGGDTGAGHYTDLINGPMDHGWCVYYTCLKRLSTFFTVVAMGTDYCIWMTGSPPTQLRFHLLNAGPDDSISMCIFFKDTRRKDVYKNNIFVEPENVQYLDGGGVQQTDGQFRPTRDQFGGANYFDRESQILHMIVKGSEPVEIRTPPVVQVSLSLAVSLDDFFNVGELVKNLAFVLKIDPNRIRVVKIVSESSTVGRRRRSLLAELNTTTITLEFGNPPAPNITTTPPPSVAMEIMMAGEINDSVDIADHTASEKTPNITNPFNDDPPENIDSFADSFNMSVTDFIDSIDNYEEILEEVLEVNELAGEVVDLVLTGGLVNVTNATVTGISVVPATPPPSPPPPVVPPDYVNATTDEGDPVIIPADEVVEVPTIPTPEASENGTSDGGTSIEFVIPSLMTVTREPLPVTGHLVHVAVSVYDNNGELVTNLGLVHPWTCQASLLTPLGRKDPNPPALSGLTRVPFVGGVAIFTRLSVDRPSSDLRLSFQSIPSRFLAETTVSFQVVGHDPSSPRDHIGFALEGGVPGLSLGSELLDHVSQGLSLAIDVDISRIQNLTVMETSAGLWVEFVLLDRQSTDPADVLGLEDSIVFITDSLNQGLLMVSVDGVILSGVPGSFQFVTDPPPSAPPSIINDAVIISIIAVAASLLVLVILLVAVVLCTCFWTRDKNKKDSFDDRGDGDKQLLFPMTRTVQVTPVPPAASDSSSNGSHENVAKLFVSQHGKTQNSLDDAGVFTDETSLDCSESSSSMRAVDCWEAPPSRHHRPNPYPPRKLTPTSQTSLSALASNPMSRAKPTPWALPQSGNHSNQPIPHHPASLFVAPSQGKMKPKPSQGRLPLSPGWS